MRQFSHSTCIMSQTFVLHPEILPSGKIDSNAKTHTHSPQQEGAGDEWWEWIVKHDARTLLLAVTLRQREGERRRRRRCRGIWLISLKSSPFLFSSFFTLLQFLSYLPPFSYFHFLPLSLVLCPFVPSLQHILCLPPVIPILPFISPLIYSPFHLSFLISVRLPFYFTPALTPPWPSGPKNQPIDCVYSFTHRSFSLLFRSVCLL